MTQRPAHMDAWQEAWEYFVAALFERLDLHDPKEEEVQAHIDALRGKELDSEQWQAATHAWSLHGEQDVDSAAWISPENAAQQAVTLRRAAQIIQA